MTRQEKLILFVVALLVLTRLGVLAREMLIAAHYGTAGMSPSDKHLWDTASALWGALVNVGAATWLFLEARAAGLKTWVWALFGLCFGLLSVALFYLVQLNSKNRASET